MCNNIVKEMKRKRGYSDVISLMRNTNVMMDTLGAELLEIAIMACLSNPKLDIEELINFAKKNSSMPISKSGAFEEMKDALQNLYTKHLEKLDDDNSVEKYIRNVALEVRIQQTLQVKLANEELYILTPKLSSLYCALGVRRTMKPDEEFLAALEHIKGRLGYSKLETFLIDLYKVISPKDIKIVLNKISAKITTNTIKKERLKEETLNKMLEQIKEFVEALLEESKELNF